MLPVQFRPDSESVRKCLIRLQRNVIYLCFVASSVSLQETLYCYIVRVRKVNLKEEEEQDDLLNSLLLRVAIYYLRHLPRAVSILSGQLEMNQFPFLACEHQHWSVTTAAE